MITTWFLSMWVSNTATAMMMVPIALSVIISLENNIGKKKVRKYSIGLLLSIAYSDGQGWIYYKYPWYYCAHCRDNATWRIIGY